MPSADPRVDWVALSATRPRPIPSGEGSQRGSFPTTNWMFRQRHRVVCFLDNSVVLPGLGFGS